MRKKIKKQLERSYRITAVILLTAGLILPVGMYEKAMSKTGNKTGARSIAEKQVNCGEEESYSIPVFKFFNWI